MPARINRTSTRSTSRTATPFSAIRILAESAGVDFSLDANPGNFPGGQNLVPPFSTTWSFSAEPPPSTNGINNTGSEFLTIGFNGNINTVLNALNTGTVRVGIHDIAFADGGSVSAVLVPEPATMALIGSALLAMGGVARRRTRKGEQ